MREALTVALQTFEGGVVIVSHDRHLIKTVADSLWLVAGGEPDVFDGDLDDYQQSGTSRGIPSPRPPKDGVKDAKPHPLSELRRQIEQIEKRIMEIGAERALIEAWLCKDPMHKGLQAQHAELTRDAASFEARWMTVGTAAEEAEASTARCQTRGR